MAETIIQFFGQPAKVNCDGNCNKAWGINNRPSVQLPDDDDDYYYLADGELGDAPADPGTYEGGHSKPFDVSEFPNKWCVRECERCNMSAMGEYNLPLAVKSFDERVFNMPWRHKEKQESNCKTCNQPHEKTHGENNEWCENCVPY